MIKKEKKRKKWEREKVADWEGACVAPSGDTWDWTTVWCGPVGLGWEVVYNSYCSLMLN